MKVERKADHAVSETSCKSATGKSLAEWFKALDKHGGVALGRRALSKWIEREHDVELWWAATITNEYEIARGDLAKDGKPKGYSICPTKSIKASPKDCFAAFATRKRSTPGSARSNSFDLREGGDWRNADGNRATFQEGQSGQEHPVHRRRRWPHLADAGRDQVRRRTATKCTVMVAIERLQTRAEADGYRRAWSAALERLESRAGRHLGTPGFSRFPDPAP